MSTFVPKGNQSPKPEQLKPSRPNKAAEAASVPATLNPFPGWNRLHDEFVVDL